MKSFSHVLVAFQLLNTACAFVSKKNPTAWSSSSLTTTKSQFKIRQPLSSVAVPLSELEKDLSDAEKTVVSVVRNNGPSVAYVTSVLPFTSAMERRRSRRGGGGSRNNKRNTSDGASSKNTTDTLPRGQNLGSGSGFVVDERGYITTNYHVVERAYQIQESIRLVDNTVDRLVGNITNATGLNFRFVNNTLQNLFLNGPSNRPTVPEVYVRINSATRYQKCRFVDVKPELDVAVLKILEPDDSNSTSTTPALTSLSFGSSSDLLVGQNLIAIGNPFGLDNTVTTGVVSAMDREIRTRSSNSRMATSSPPIRNCIQTDCAINPGNSGGPLLNTKGEVVGINTAIVTTSGSNAGIGFAVPSDQVKPVVQDMIRKDLRKQTVQKAKDQQVWLGVAIVRATAVSSTSLSNDDKKDNGSEENSATVKSRLASKNWIASVVPNSPAAKAGLKALRIVEQEAGCLYGDAIVAIGGNIVSTYEQLQAELDQRVPGEQISVTVEDGQTNEKRVVYVTLEKYRS